MNLFNIKKAYINKKAKNWEKVFWVIDAHDTIFHGLYERLQENVFYPFAKEVLQFLSSKDDVVLILFTCSYEDEIYRMIKYLNCTDIHFDYVNENPEVSNTTYGDYSKKMYCNILLEDKAGFEPKDWYAIKKELELIYKEIIK